MGKHTAVLSASVQAEKQGAYSSGAVWEGGFVRHPALCDRNTEAGSFSILIPVPYFYGK